MNPSQRSGGNYIQPSAFSSQGGDDWGRGGGGGGAGGGGGGGGGGRRDNIKSNDFSFSTQNRYSTLTSTPNTFDKGGKGKGVGEEDEKTL